MPSRSHTMNRALLRGSYGNALALVVLCSDPEKMLLPPEAFEVGRGVSDSDRFIDSLPSHRTFPC